MEHPFMTNYGAVTLKPDAAFQPDNSLTYKVLFDIRETSNEAGEINQGLDHVAKLLNFLVLAGIDVGNAAIIAILHGPAVTALLQDQIYLKKFGLANPNTAIIHELTGYGVQIYACVQALTKQNLAYTAVHEKVSLALASLLVIIHCQLHNYAYVPFN
jgi:intracellular sulfur oxidation DsrE/DsrF family protein